MRTILPFTARAIEVTAMAKRWYVIHTYSGYENKVKDNIEKSVENNGGKAL